MGRVAFGSPDVWPTISVPGFSVPASPLSPKITSRTSCEVGRQSMITLWRAGEVRQVRAGDRAPVEQALDRGLISVADQ